MESFCMLTRFYAGNMKPRSLYIAVGYICILIFFHLFVQRPPGIMCTLDDVCSTMHAVSEGSEKTLMEVYNKF